MAKYKFYLGTGYVGSDHEDIVEIPDDELEGLTEQETEDYIYENYYKEWAWNHLDATFWKIEEQEKNS